MSMMKTAAAGMIGFMMGAGAMMAPGSQKVKRQARRQVEKLSRMVKMW